MNNHSHLDTQAHDARPHPVRLLLVVAFLVMTTTQSARAAEIRYHGLTLSDQYRLQLEEIDGTVSIFLLKKDRAAGGPVVPKSLPKNAGDNTMSPVIRIDTREPLAQIRVEILRTAAPNYVRNPGDRYRIAVDGQDTAPGYTRTFEVDAANALTAVYTEFARIFSTTYGIRREALYQGALVSLRILNEAQRLPAEIPLTTKRSRVGRFRIQGDTLSRAKVTPLAPGSMQSVTTDTQPQGYWKERQRLEHAEPFDRLKRTLATTQIDPRHKSHALASIAPSRNPNVSTYADIQTNTLEMLQGAPLDTPMKMRAARGKK